MLRLTFSAAAPELIKIFNIWWKAFGGIPDSSVGTVTGVLDEKVCNRSLSPHFELSILQLVCFFVSLMMAL